MSLIMKKEVGLGVPVDNAYVRFPRAAWLSDPMQWHVWVETWYNKDVRVLNVAQKWVEGICRLVNNPIAYSAKIAKKYDIPKQHWDEIFNVGPWEDPEQMVELMKSEIQQVYTHPAQTYSVFFDIKEVNVNFETNENTMASIYEEVKKCEVPLFSLISSSNVTRSEVFTKMKDDTDGPDKMIERACNKWKSLEPTLAAAEKIKVGYYDVVSKTEVGDESFFNEKPTNLIKRDKLFKV